jgi:Fic family protein
LRTVDPERFQPNEFGAVMKTPGRHGYWTFIPAQVPRSLELSSETVSKLSEADRALGRLAGAGRLLPNPHLLVNAYITREAVSSSRIEGTQASMSDVFDAESRGDLRGDVAEVVDYVRAMETGIERLATLPISRRLVEDIHGVLLSGVRGQERSPGEVRRSQNWIGSNTPSRAVFVPPPVDAMEQGLSDWERFVHEERAMPPLMRCALMHYQFETLHPFLDGNGRLGRLLIIFFLLSEGHLPAPLLYVSAFFDRHKGEYYDRLQAVRETGDIQGWLRFFLQAVATQATDALGRAERLTDLREQYRARLLGSRSRAHEIVDMLLENPFVAVGAVSRTMKMTSQGVTNLIRQLERQGIVRPAARLPGRSNRWVCEEILDILSAE